MNLRHFLRKSTGSPQKMSQEDCHPYDDLPLV